MEAIRIATLAAAALCVGMTTVAAAQGAVSPQQEQGRGEMRGGGMGGRLLKDITLTVAQKEQIKTIREKYMPQQMELRKAVQATGGPPDEATRAKMRDLQNRQVAEIRAILTAEQKVTFDKNLTELKARMDARRDGSS